MSDLIDRKSAVSRMSDLLMLELKGKRLPTWNEVYRAFQELPTILTPAEDTSYWIIDAKRFGDVHHHCSRCGALVEVVSDDEWKYRNWWYCPNCGAKMDGERRAEDEQQA